MVSGVMSPKDLTTPKQLYPDTVLVADGKPMALIVRPADPRFEAPAARVRDRVRELTGADLPVRTDAEVASEPDRNLLLLGNVNSNRVIFRLYGSYYTPADDLYPGSGGFLVHTMHDPWGNGRQCAWGCWEAASPGCRPPWTGSS